MTRLRNLLEQGRIEEISALLNDVHPADIADILDQLSPDEAVAVFQLLPIETASEVLDETGSLVRQELVEQVDEEHVGGSPR